MIKKSIVVLTMEIKPLDESRVPCKDCFKQFALHHESSFEHPGWTTEALGDWKLSRSESLPRLRVRKFQKTIGVVLGWVVDEGRSYAEDGEISLDAGTDLEELHRRLVGRFALFAVSGSGEVSISVDASGQIPVVYDERSGRVASAPAVLAKFREIAVDHELVADAARSDGTTWFPFGTVPFEGLKRLLPGHVLSPSVRTVSRIPVGAEPLKPDPNATITAILDAMSSTIRPICQRERVKAHLTAGIDSRMVLAAAIRANASITLTTIRRNDGGSRLDDYMARGIAKMCGLPHESVPLLKPSRDEIEAWHHRTGYCIDDAVVGLCRTVREGFDESTVLTSGCGEVGRAFYWHSSDLGEVGIEPDVLVDRLGFARSRRLVEKAASWVDEVGPTRSRTLLLDMTYIEQRLAGWAGPAVYGHAIPKPTISPFNSQQIFDDMMSLPEELRLSGELPRSLIHAVRPDLLDFPFNRASGFSRLRFPKQEIKRHLPPGLKTRVRGMLRRWA